MRFSIRVQNIFNLSWPKAFRITVLPQDQQKTGRKTVNKYIFCLFLLLIESHSKWGTVKNVQSPEYQTMILSAEIIISVLPPWYWYLTRLTLVYHDRLRSTCSVCQAKNFCIYFPAFLNTFFMTSLTFWHQTWNAWLPPFCNVTPCPRILLIYASLGPIVIPSSP